jgi:hypothetical protein
MARAKKAPAAPVTYDAADLLVARLNEIQGIDFVRDAWESKAPDQYGVVELDGQSGGLWVDNRLVDQVFQATVHLYVTGGSDVWVGEVQGVLEDVCDGYRLQTREYLFDINQTHWEWVCEIIGPIMWEETEPDG